MFECSNIIEQNAHKLKRIPRLDKGGVVTVRFNGEDFNSTSLVTIFSQINAITSTYGRGCKKVIFQCSGFKPRDEFAYIMLECVLYTVKFKYGYEVELLMDKMFYTVEAPGLRSSLLNYFLPFSKNDKLLQKKYRSDLTQTHFRRIVSAEDESEVSLFMGDLKTFLKGLSVHPEYSEEVSNVVSELVDNACEHTGTDCLADIYVSKPTYKKIGEEGFYYVINFVVINFSEKCLYEDIKKKIENGEYPEESRYKTLKNAYEKHKSYFHTDGSYNEIDFFNIASFQDCISGRSYESKTGGTGLTELIKSLEEHAVEHTCYVLSGEQGIEFEPKYLVYNDGWIGFNEEKDLFEHKPAQEALLRSAVNFLGTGYNFNLIVKKDVE